jgi:hypothetical protein
MALAAATLFAIPADGGTSPLITRSYLTDVIRARAGTEKRASLRATYVRSIAYTALFGNQNEASDFRNLWLAAGERLRFLVPLWPEYAVPTSFPTTSTIAGDFTNRDFVQGAQVLVWLDRTHYEAATLTTLASSLLTLSAPLVGTYPALATRIVPLMPAWLEPPTLTMLETASETVPVVFREEVQGAAGVDASVGVRANATCTSVIVEPIYGDTGWAGRRFFGWRVHAYDAAGAELPDPVVTWTCVATGDVSIPPARFTVSGEGRFAGLQYVGGADSTFSLSATVGSITASFTAGG